MTGRAARPLLDYLVGASEDFRRDRQAECLGSLSIDNQLDLRGLLDRQLSRSLALANPPGIDTRQAIGIGYAGSVAHQTAGRCELAKVVDSGRRVACRQSSEPFMLAGEERIGVDEERTDPLLWQRREGHLNVVQGDGSQDYQFQTKRIRGSLDLSRINLNIRIARIYQIPQHDRIGRHLVQQFELLCRQDVDQKAYARDITARPAEAVDKTKLDGVV